MNFKQIFKPSPIKNILWKAVDVFQAYSSKKQKERTTLNRFLHLVKVTPTRISENETPDFDLVVGDRAISVELTDLIDPKVKKIEMYRSRIIEMAKCIFIRKNGDIISAKFIFANVELKGGKENELQYAVALSNAVELYCKGREDEQFNDTIEFEGHHCDFLHEILVANDQGSTYWEDFGAHGVPGVDENWLKSRIKNKEEHLGKYSDTYDECWLILTARFGKKSSAFSFDFVVDQYISSFDKIFLYKLIDDEVMTLK